VFDFPYAVMMGRTVNPELRPTLDLNFRDNQDVGSDITYTGGAYRTKYDSDGVLGYAPHNLLLQSQTIGTSPWLVRDAYEDISIDDNVVGIAAPDGTETATEVIENSDTDVHVVDTAVETVLASTYYIVSMYFKANTRTWAFIANNQGASGAAAWFNLATGSIGTYTTPGNTPTITNVGGGWYRCSATFLTTSTSLRTTFGLASADNTSSYAGDGSSSLYMWGAQRTLGSTLLSYVATTTAAVWEPRFDHVLKSRTNHIRNNTMQGAVAGTPGTAPTNWTVTASGVTVELVGTGVENGVDYAEYRFGGADSTPSGDPNILLETTTVIDALTTETWTVSAYFALVAGDFTNITSIRFIQQERQEDGTYIKGHTGDDIKDGFTSSLQRFSSTETFDGSGTAHTRPYLDINWDGSGDIDITLRIGLPQMERAAAATDAIKTYYNAVTEDEWRDHNFITDSDDFSTWTLNQAGSGTGVLDANSFANPVDGALTADRVTVTGGTNLIRRRSTPGLIEGEEYTFLAWIYLISADGSASLSTDFGDGTQYNHFSDLIVGEWVRYQITTIAGSGGSFVDMYTADDIDFYIWGAQVTRGSELLDYTATTTAAVAATLEFVPVGLSVFEARTNLILQSEALNVDGSGSPWTHTSTTVTANQAVAPDGTTTADKLSHDDTTSSVQQTIAITADADHVWSIHVKVAGSTARFIKLNSQAGSDAFSAWFDITRGVKLSAAVGGNGVSTAHDIQSVGDGWYRIWIAGSIKASRTSTVPAIEIVTADASSTEVASQAIYVWGAQGEDSASFPTPYVKTTTGTVAATVDVPTMTGTNFSSWFNDSEGTFFAQYTEELASVDTFAPLFTVNDGDNSDKYAAAFSLNNKMRVEVKDGGVGQVNIINLGDAADGTTQKLAVAYKLNDVAASVDGGAVSTDTSVTLPTVDRLQIGWRNAGEQLNGNIARITYWPRRLSDIALQNLTI
jgi:hypothetical protein